MMDKQKKARSSTFALFMHILRYYRPFAGVFIPCLLLWASQDFLGSLIPALLQQGIVSELLAPDGTMGGIFLHVGIILLLRVGYILSYAISNHFLSLTEERGRAHYTTSVLDGFLHRAKLEGTVQGMTAFTSDIDQSFNSATSTLKHLFLSVIAILGSGGVIFAIDWRLCAIGVAMGLGFMAVDLLFARKLRSTGADIQASLEKSNLRLRDILTGALSMRLFGIGDKAVAAYQDTASSLRGSSLRKVRLMSFRSAIDAMREWIMLAGIIAIGCVFVARGEITIPSLVLASNLIGQLLYKFSLMSSYLVNMQHGMASAERVFSMLDEPMESVEPPASPPEHSVTGVALATSNLSFHYDGDRNTGVENINLSIRAGERVAIVGASGGGKSTLMRLLLGLTYPEDGTMQASGLSFDQAHLGAWRAQFGYVPQDVTLLDGTIEENIYLRGQEATHPAIADALKNYLRFVADFPGGLSSHIGELGNSLSIGQRQRIGIARALASGAPILLLDEATSALDKQTEETVLNELFSISKASTILYITHRLSSAQRADRILVMDQGRLAGTGTHQELCANSPAYAALIAQE